MKKISLFIFAIIISLGGVFISPIFTNAADDIVANEIKVSSVEEFKSEMNKANADTTIKLTNDLNFANQTIQIDTFSGKLDGNGYAISNFGVTSENHNYGLVNHLNGGTISNLKISGTIEYNLVNSVKTPVNVGSVAGLVSNGGVIKNCEIISVNYKTIGNETLSFTTQFTFGGIAGAVVDSKSMITNSVNHASVELSTSLSANNLMRAGGIVGRLHDGNVSFCSALGDIVFAATESSSNITFYNGGIIGEVEGSTTKAYNLTYEGDIRQREEGNYASDFTGAIVGRISTLVDANQIDLSNCYYTNENFEKAFAENSVYTYDETKVSWVKEITRSFYTQQSERWHKRYGEWDFDYTWIMLNEENGTSKLHLQCFQMFEYSFNDFLDADGIISSNSIIESSCKYGDKVRVDLIINEDYRGYFELKQVLLNSSPMNEYEAEQTRDGYTVSFDANDKTDGKYSFKMEAIPFKCFVVSSDINMGGVKRLGDRVLSSSLELNLTYARNESQRQTIVSETDVHSIYTPEKWELYYWTGSEEANIGEGSEQFWEKQSDNFSSNSQIEIMFGSSEAFDRSFKLVAKYTDQKALIVNVRGDENVTSIKFRGNDMTDAGIKASPTETRAELVVSVKEGYELDVDRLKSVVSSLYGNNNVGTLIPSPPQENESGETIYYIYLNMRDINSNQPTNMNVVFNVYTKVKIVEEEGNLLWLWITLPIVVVLIVVGLVLFFVLRRYRYMNAKFKNDSATNKTNKKKQPKEKQADYKDFYY